MESLSSVSTILGIVHDILVAVETTIQNKSRCMKVAERVRCIKDILEATAQDDAGTTSTDAVTRRLMDKLKKALSDALQVVRHCQRNNDNFLGNVICVFAGGQMVADSLDEVEREMNECILDLTFANSLRLNKTLLVRRKHKDVAAASSSISENDDDENKRKNKGFVESVVPNKMMNHVDNTTTTAAATGVPVYTVNTAVVHEHRHVTMDDGYCFTCRSYSSHCYYCHCCRAACRCQDDDTGGSPSSNAALYHTQYYNRPLMFSDENPNSCSIT